MIGKTLAGVDASLDLTIEGVAVNYNSIVNLTFETGESLHDYACVEISGIPTRAITDYYGAPVRFLAYTGPKFVHEFIGTIEDVEPVSVTKDGLVNGYPFQQARLHCYGASYRMRGNKSRVWEQVSLPAMAEELADTYGFSLDVPSVPVITSRYVQESESDWAALTKYSAMHGYKVNVHGTHMHIYDPLAALSRNRSLHKLTRKGIEAHPGKVIQMKGRFGRDANDGTQFDVVVPVLLDNGTSFDVRSSEVLGTQGASYDRRISDAVDTYGEAKRRILAETRDKYDWHAEVECLGLAGAYPGGVVDIAHYKGDFDGFWYVRSVKHIINTNAFTSYLNVSRNLNAALRFTTTSSYRRPPTPEFRSGKWQASKKMVNIYG